MRLVIAGILAGCLISSTAGADQYIYKSTNKIDFIKLDKAKKSEKEGGLTHPYTFDGDQMRSILRSVHFNKKILLLKDVENRQLFDEGNVEFLTPYLIEAFQKAGPETVVVASYFTRDTKLVIQNDRLTIFRAYVKGDGLHIKFTKTYAKLLGDRTTKGLERTLDEARSMRVSLELQPGQNRIQVEPEEIVFDLAHYGPGGKSAEERVAEKKGKKKVEAKSDSARASSAPVASASEEERIKSIRVRLKELDQMKKDELITEKEYKKKRKDLLKEF